MIISFTENVATPTNFPNCCQNIFCFQSLCSKMVTKSAARRKYSHESWYLNQQLNRPSVASHFVLRQSVYNEFITPFSPKVLVTLTEKTVSLSNMHVHLKIKHSGVPFWVLRFLHAWNHWHQTWVWLPLRHQIPLFFWKELAYILLIYL